MMDTQKMIKSRGKEDTGPNRKRQTTTEINRQAEDYNRVKYQFRLFFHVINKENMVYLSGVKGGDICCHYNTKGEGTMEFRHSHIPLIGH